MGLVFEIGSCGDGEMGKNGNGEGDNDKDNSRDDIFLTNEKQTKSKARRGTNDFFNLVQDVHFSWNICSLLLLGFG